MELDKCETIGELSHRTYESKGLEHIQLVVTISPVTEYIADAYFGLLLHTCEGYHGYFWESHLISNGVLEISSVIWRLCSRDGELKEYHFRQEEKHLSSLIKFMGFHAYLCSVAHARFQKLTSQANTKQTPGYIFFGKLEKYPYQITTRFTPIWARFLFHILSQVTWQVTDLVLDPK